MSHVTLARGVASASLIGFTNPNTDRKHALAVDAINKRAVRKLCLRHLVPSFVLSADTDISEQAREAIGAFERDLPYEYEEQKRNERLHETLLRDAKFHAEFAKPENYRAFLGETPDEQVVVLENPQAETPEARERLQRSTEQLQDNSLWFWANKSLEGSALSPDLDPVRAVGFAKHRDATNLFDGTSSKGVEIGMRRGAVAAAAAVVLKFRDHFQPQDLTWARAIVERVAKMPELRDSMWNTMAIVPWHPGISAARGLASEIRAGDQAAETRRMLFRLIAHPLDGVSLAALEEAQALAKAEPRLAWCALWQGLALCQFDIDHSSPGARSYDPEYIAAAHESRAIEAIQLFENPDTWPDLPKMPSAWVVRVVS